MKNYLIAACMATALVAGEYITLDNGKVIYLKDDGTWQEVQVVKKGGETLAIKPDGTWEKVEATKVEAANTLERAADKKHKDEPTVKRLIGSWSGDGVRYTFTPQTATFKLKEGHHIKTISGKWIVEKIEGDTITVNIGEGARLGFLTFGGDIRKLRVIDENTIEDITDRLSGKVYTLHRVR